MKQKLLVVATALIMTFSATFAQENKLVPEAIVSGLQQQFGNATDVQWLVTDNFYKASLTLD